MLATMLAGAGWMASEPESKLHAWHIEPREYTRQEERRGRRHAFAHLDPHRTGLLVIVRIVASPWFPLNASSSFSDAGATESVSRWRAYAVGWPPT
jgi:hypothetical protein